MQQEYMRALCVCVDNDAIWIIDELIYGLYSIDKKTYEVKCVIDSWNLFRYGKFKPDTLICWKEDYIVIIPLEIDKKWVIYNKTNGRIEYKTVVSTKCLSSLAGIYKPTNQGFFCPVCAKDPVLVIDFERLIGVEVISNWCEKKIADNSDTIRGGIYDGKSIFFPLLNTKILVRVCCQNKNVELLRIDIPENILDISVFNGEFWVLPENGNMIYQIDENGMVMDNVRLTDFQKNLFASEFARIVNQENNIFLLPYHQQSVCVYNKIKKKMITIDGERIFLNNDKINYSMYWGYYIEDHEICFLPWMNKCLCVDLETLSYKNRNILYPAFWTECEVKYKYSWNFSLGPQVASKNKKDAIKYSCNFFPEQKFVFGEKDENSLRAVLEYLSDIREKDNQIDIKNNGKAIWKNLVD